MQVSVCSPRGVSGECLISYHMVEDFFHHLLDINNVTAFPTIMIGIEDWKKCLKKFGLEKIHPYSFDIQAVKLFMMFKVLCAVVKI